MKRKSQKSGFTLIEIIVVLIIVGVLAAVALPNLFGNIQKSKSAQAFALMDGIKTSVEACLVQNSTTSPNAAPCQLSSLNVTSVAGGWTVTISNVASNTAASQYVGSLSQATGTVGASSAQYTLEATDNNSAHPNAITLTRSTSGIWSCSVGTGSSYTGVC